MGPEDVTHRDGKMAIEITSIVGFLDSARFQPQRRLVLACLLHRDQAMGTMGQIYHRYCLEAEDRSGPVHSFSFGCQVSGLLAVRREDEAEEDARRQVNSKFDPSVAF